MALSDKIKDLAGQLEALQSEAQALEAPKSDDQAQSPTSVSPDLSGALKALQDKFDALGKERDAYKAAIQAEIDDAKADSDRLEKAIEPVEAVEVPKVEDVVKDQAPQSAQPAQNPDQSAPTGDQGQQTTPAVKGDDPTPKDAVSPADTPKDTQPNFDPSKQG